MCQNFQFLDLIVWLICHIGRHMKIILWNFQYCSVCVNSYLYRSSHRIYFWNLFNFLQYVLTHNLFRSAHDSKRSTHKSFFWIFHLICHSLSYMHPNLLIYSFHLESCNQSIGINSWYIHSLHIINIQISNKSLTFSLIFFISSPKTPIHPNSPKLQICSHFLFFFTSFLCF